jgi:hypothetical protein
MSGRGNGRAVDVVCPDCDWLVERLQGGLARRRALTCYGCKRRLAVEPEQVRVALRRAARRRSLLRRFSPDVVDVSSVVVAADRVAETWSQRLSRRTMGRLRQIASGCDGQRYA